MGGWNASGCGKAGNAILKEKKFCTAESLFISCMKDFIMDAILEQAIKAIKEDNPEALEKLLNKEPSLIMAKTHDGMSLPMLAAYYAFNVTPLHSATAIQHLELVRLLISKGANVNARQVNGITPLHTAAHYGNQELINILIRAGADPKIKTNDGKTPKNMAFENGYSDLNDI